MSPDLIISVSHDRSRELRERAARQRAAATWRRANPGHTIRDRVVARFGGNGRDEHTFQHRAPRARQA